MSLQDLQTNTNSFDPTVTYDDFLDQMLSGLQSTVSWSDVSAGEGETGQNKSTLPWDVHHFDDQSAILSSKLHQHQIIGCFIRSGEVNTAFHMYKQMQCEGIKPSSVNILTMVSRVSEYTHVQSFHASSIQYGFVCDLSLMNSILNSYGRCRRVIDARNLFESMDKRDIVSWNSLVSAYALIDNVEKFQSFYQGCLSRSLISAVGEICDLGEGVKEMMNFHKGLLTLFFGSLGLFY